MSERAFHRAVMRAFVNYRARLVGLAVPENQPHSPLYRAKHGLDDRKSRIFEQKPQITGRKAKFFFTVCVLSVLWGLYKSEAHHEVIR